MAGAVSLQSEPRARRLPIRLLRCGHEAVVVDRVRHDEDAALGNAHRPVVARIGGADGEKAVEGLVPGRKERRARGLAPRRSFQAEVGLATRERRGAGELGGGERHMVGGKVVPMDDQGIEAAVDDRAPELRGDHGEEAADTPPGRCLSHELGRVAGEEIDIPGHGPTEAAIVSASQREIGKVKRRHIQTRVVG